MGVKFAPIRECVSKIKTWDPKKSGGEDVFLYIDLSSVDKDEKVVEPSLVSKVISVDAPSRARQLVRAGDVLVSTVRPNLNGVAEITKYFDGATASTGYCVLRPDPKKLDTKYLYYWVQTESFISYMVRKATGVNYPAVSDRIIKDSLIPLPPLTEQKRIAAILDKADAIRRKRQQAIQLADQFLRAVFLDMFGDPVRNPKGWEVRELGEIVDTQLGKMLSKKARLGVSPKKYLRNANVRWRNIITSDLLEMDFNDKEQRKFELRYGDLLVCEGGEVGRCGIWYSPVNDCYFQKALHRIRPKKEVVVEYLQEVFYWLSKKGGFSGSVSEVTFAHLTAEKLKQIKIPVPPIDMQRRFSELYDKHTKILFIHESKIEATENMFFSLSQKAFAGEL